MAESTIGAEALTFFYPTQPLRHVWRDDVPWFVAADLLRALDLDRKALERLDDEEKGVSSIHTPGGPQEVAIVNESGLYSLILGSRKPEAKRFKKWVTAEVLPAIRRTGRYESAAADNSQSLVLTGLMGQLGDLQSQLAQRDAALAAKNEAIIGLQAQVIAVLTDKSGVQDVQAKLLRRIDGLKQRMSAREASHTMIEMERNGEPRELIALRTGRTPNHIRQVLLKARRAGVLPPLAEGNFAANLVASARTLQAAQAAAQSQLDLGANHGC